jgi:hypothetical protein
MMTFEEYIQSLTGPKLSPVKLQLLRALWGEDDRFTQPWIASSYLLEITGQKYFDRRTRELRDDNGCMIETTLQQGEHQYRLASLEIGPINPRRYLTNTQKTKLFLDCDHRCQVCGLQIQPGVRGLQADHRVPLNRNGTHDIENWQALCNECNVAKRRACQDCHLDCQKCVWAFPIENELPITVYLPQTHFDKVKEETDSDQNWLRNLIISGIDKKDG